MPEHRDGRRQTPRHAGPLHHEANGVLEDEREEDADEDDQERVADRCECDHEPDRGRDDEDRAHRQDELDAA